MNYGLEVVVIPVSDVDEATNFYQALGWRLDVSFTGGPDYRVVQLTPATSARVFNHAGTTARVAGPAPGELWLVRPIRIPGRQRLARAGDQHPAAAPVTSGQMAGMSRTAVDQPPLTK